jgi:hypothetical protein
VFIEVPLVQVDPLKDSVDARSPPGLFPPKAKAAVCVPQPANSPLTVFKPPGLFVQVEPSYSSVDYTPGAAYPPKAKPAV